jgi:hypothetical protein
MGKSWAGLLLALLGATGLQAQVDYGENPSRFLQLELLDVGLGYGYGQSEYETGYWHGAASVHARVLKLMYADRGLRVGLSAIELYSSPIFDVIAYGTFLPVHVGYNLLMRPVPSWKLYGMYPSCYVEATAGLQPYVLEAPLYARLALACDIDYFGPGAGIEAGVESHLGHDSGHRKFNVVGALLYVSLKLRLATSFGF